MFFLDDDFCRRRVADIRFISNGRSERRGSADRWVHDVRMADGEDIVLLDVIVAQISKIPAHVLPAEPGLMAWSGEDEDGADFLTPVLGWAITVDGNVHPVTVGGVDDGHDGSTPIVYPNGRVSRSGFNWYESLAAYKAAFARDDS